MSIHLQEIQALFPDYQTLLIEKAPGPALSGWIPEEAPQTVFLPHMLYLRSYNAACCSKLLTQPDVQVLCVVEDAEQWAHLPADLSRQSHILFLLSDNKLEIYKILQKFFDVQWGLALFSSDMLELLSSDAGIQAFVDLAFLALHNPIGVFDANFHLIAANYEEIKKLDFASELLDNSGFSDSDFELLNSRDCIHRRVLKSEVPIQSYNQRFRVDQLLCAIDTQKDVGHIVVTAIHRPFTPADSQLLLGLKNCVSQQLKKEYSDYSADSLVYEYILRDLLDGKFHAEKRTQLCTAHKEFSGTLYGLVVSHAKSAAVMNSQKVRNELNAIFPQAKTILYHEQIVGVLQFRKQESLTRQNINDLIKICEENELLAGLSNPFDDIVDFLEYYRQAERSIKFGISCASASPLSIYSDYYMEHLKYVFLQKESADTFCHPKMKYLIRYDKKHNSELAYTLYIYLLHEQNISKTASEMHMHRNSVIYRIHKIQSLIGEDFGDHFERQYQILSYRMMCNQSFQQANYL